MPSERFHGAEDDGLPADRAILLRSASTGAQAPTGSDNDGGASLNFSHGISIWVA